MRRKSRLGITPIIRAKAEEKPKKEEPKKDIKYSEVIVPREITLNDKAKLVFSVSKTSEGDYLVDIRTHVKTADYEGRTKKGINFNVENLEEFMTIMEEINEELEDKGI